MPLSPMSLAVPSIRLVEDDSDHRPHAAYEVEVALDGQRFSTWRRWSECRAFAARLSPPGGRRVRGFFQEPPRFPDSQQLPNLLKAFTNADLDTDPAFLHPRRRAQLEEYFAVVLQLAPSEALEFLTPREDEVVLRSPAKQAASGAAAIDALIARHERLEAADAADAATPSSSSRACRRRRRGSSRRGSAAPSASRPRPAERRRCRRRRRRAPRRRRSPPSTTRRRRARRRCRRPRRGARGARRSRRAARSSTSSPPTRSSAPPAAWPSAAASPRSRRSGTSAPPRTCSGSRAVPPRAAASPPCRRSGTAAPPRTRSAWCAAPSSAAASRRSSDLALAATHIQRVVRGAAVRRRLASLQLLWKSCAATHVQRVLRGHQTASRRRGARGGGAGVQGCVRGRNMRRMMIAVWIQSAVRGYLVRRRLHRVLRMDGEPSPRRAVASFGHAASIRGHRAPPPPPPVSFDGEVSTLLRLASTPRQTRASAPRLRRSTRCVARPASCPRPRRVGRRQKGAMGGETSPVTIFSARHALHRRRPARAAECLRRRGAPRRRRRPDQGGQGALELDAR